MHKPGQCTYHVKVTNHLEEEPPIQDHPLESRDLYIDQSDEAGMIFFISNEQIYNIVIKIHKKYSAPTSVL